MLEFRSKIELFIQSQYETLAAWLNSGLINEDVIPRLKPRYITYYIQCFLIASVFDFYLKNKPDGRPSLLEIGCAGGNLSEILSQIAKNNDTLYLALDPWNGMQEGDQQKYEAFLNRIDKNKEFCRTFKQSSLEPNAVSILNENNVKLVYIDGLHFTEAALQDIYNCRQSKTVDLICVDDLAENTNTHVQRAFDLAIQNGLITPIETKNQPAYYKVSEFKQYKFAWINRA